MIQTQTINSSILPEDGTKNANMETAFKENKSKERNCMVMEQESSKNPSTLTLNRTWQIAD